MRDDALVLKQARKSMTRVEVARSFSYKLNVGNYESRDFFCSEKAECSIEDAADVSAALYQFCRMEVLKAVSEYRLEFQKQQAAKEAQDAIRQQVLRERQEGRKTA